MNLFASISKSITNLLNRLFPSQTAQPINPELVRMFRRQARSNAIFEEVSPGHLRTRPGRHPLETRSKYTGSGALRK